MNRIFTLLMLGLFCFAWKPTKAQSITFSFTTASDIPANTDCWTNNNFDFVNTKPPGPGPASGALAAKNKTATLITPYIDLSAGQTIQFNHRANNTTYTYTFAVSLVSLTGTILAPDANATSTTYSSYTYTVPTTGTYRIRIDYTTSATNQFGNNNYAEIDDLIISGSYHYSSFCNSAPIAVDDNYSSVSFPTLTVTGNILTNDTDPNKVSNGETLSVFSNSTVTSGTLTVNTDGTFSFTPSAGFTGGPVTFTYTVSDNGYSPLTSNTSTPATVTINYPVFTTPLPIKLLSFTGHLSNNQALLQWSVDDNETGNYFKVEKSVDGKNFTEAAVVLTSGKNGKQDYSFKESIPSGKAVYYRLQIVNNDAPPAYSKTVLIKPLLTATSASIDLATNPVGSMLRFSFTADLAEQATVHIYTIHGTKVLSQQLTTVKGVNAMELDASSLSSGLYVLEVSSKTTSRRTRFLK